MIKRALGLWADSGAPGSGDEGEDEGLTAKQREKLERRLLPGGLVNGSRGQFRAAFMGSPEESEEEDEGDEEAGESEDDPAMPPEEEKQMRGQFRCELCPDKIIMNEKILEQHLQSEAHLKNARRFERAKVMGLEAFEAECRAKAEARQEGEGAVSKRQQKNQAYWEKRRQKREKRSGEAHAKQLSDVQIEARKDRFQRKKARRLERKGVAPPEEAGTKRRKEAAKGTAEAAAGGGAGKMAPPSGLNRKQRRALAAQESAQAAAADGTLPTVAKPAGGKAETPAAEGGQPSKKRRKKAAA